MSVPYIIGNPYIDADFAAGSTTSTITYLPPYTNAVSQNLTTYLAQTITVTDFGAKGDSSTDNLTAFTNALSYAASLSGGGTIHVPGASGYYYLSGGITIPNGWQLAGDDWIFTVPPVGTVLGFANSVSVCVNLASGSNQTADMRDIAVWRIGGTPPASSTGIRCNQGSNVKLTNVFSVNHARLYSFIARSVNGITAELIACYGSQASENYFYIDSWPELKIIGGRMGIDGSADYTCNAFFYITGLDTSGGGGVGPNTIVVTQTQLNQGNSLPAYFAEFDATSTTLPAVFVFDAMYVEGLGTAAIKSTSSVPLIQRVFLGAGTIFNAPSVPFFALDAATSIGQFEFNGAKLYCSAFTLALNQDEGIVSFIGGEVSGAATITGSSSHVSGLVIEGTAFNGGLTIAGKFEGLAVTTGSNVTMSATAFSGTSLLQVNSYGAGMANSTNRPQYVAPGAVVGNPGVNGYYTVEFTSNTTLTFKGRGSDGVTRTATLTLT